MIKFSQITNFYMSYYTYDISGQLNNFGQIFRFGNNFKMNIICNLPEAYCMKRALIEMGIIFKNVKCLKNLAFNKFSAKFKI